MLQAIHVQGQTLYIGEVCIILVSCDYIEIKRRLTDQVCTLQMNAREHMQVT